MLHTNNAVFPQQRAAEEELEASEHRVHVMTADIASLQTRLAEQADVIRHGRALADKVGFAAWNLRTAAETVWYVNDRHAFIKTWGFASVYTSGDPVPVETTLITKNIS